jgi:WD40 repeat protein
MKVLKVECFGCHNAEKKKGGLVLTSRQTLLDGGDDGAVVVPGKPELSRLAKALLRDSDPHMPPKKQLPDVQVKIIHDWIKGGVAWDAGALAEDENRINPVELLALPGSYRPVTALALSPDGQKLAVARGGSVVVHDASQTNYPVLAQWEAHRDAVQALAWSGDGLWLATGAFRRTVLWDGQSFRLTREWTNGTLGCVTAIRFAPDGRTLALADGITAESGFVRLISVADGKLAASWRAHADTIFGMDFSRDGQRLVTAGGDKLIKIWDVGSTKELSRLEGHTAQVLGVAFNTNATQLVSAGADKQLRVWDLQTREKIISLGNHSAAVSAVAWGGEENVIVASTEEGGVFIYKNLKPHTGEQSSGSGDEKRIGDAGDAVLSIALPPDAKRVFAGSHDGIVHVWSSEGKLLTKLEPSTVATAAAMTRLSLSNAVTQPRAPALPKAKVASRPPQSKISGIDSLEAEPRPATVFSSPRKRWMALRLMSPTMFDSPRIARLHSRSPGPAKSER